jgi:pimeloyl-ACP methyl ester carboxylesterase
MPLVAANGIEINYEEDGDPAGPPLVLVNGLGGQLIGWRPELVPALVERGFRVIRFDNRDVGLSTWVEDGYGLDDMADDLAGLLDALGIEAAHVLGVSLGGMIVQTFAIRHPQRLLSLCSIMSTVGAPGLAPPTPEALAVLLRKPAADRESSIEQSVEGFRVISSPGYPFDEEGVRQRAAAAYDRAYHPAGVGRQLAAVAGAGDRTEALGSVAVPTLVLHGTDDPLIGVAAGEATAKAVPGARLVLFEGMGHDVPAALVPEIVDAVVANTLLSS